jgi:hypothetical protein
VSGTTSVAAAAIATLWVVPAITAHLTVATGAAVAAWALPASTLNVSQVISVGALCVGVPRYDQRVIADGAAAYWRLNDPIGTTTVSDAIGAHDGTVPVDEVNFEQPGAIAGTDTAAEFLGGTIVNGIAPIPYGVEASYEAWFKPNDGRLSVLVSHDPAMMLAAAQEEIDGAGGKFVFWSAATGRADATALVGTTQYAFGTWYHVVAVRDASGRRLYVNGVLEAADSDTAAWSTSSANWRIAHSLAFFADGGRAAGVLDEIAFYPTALTAEQVAAHYAARLVASSWSLPVPTIAFLLATAFVVIDIRPDASEVVVRPDATTITVRPDPELRVP